MKVGSSPKPWLRCVPMSGRSKIRWAKRQMSPRTKSPRTSQKRCHARRHWNSPSYRTAAGLRLLQSNTISVPSRSHIGTHCHCFVTKAYLSACIYGAEGARTPDLCNANAALSQLSYSPVPRFTHQQTQSPAPRRGATQALDKVAIPCRKSSFPRAICRPRGTWQRRCAAVRVLLDSSPGWRADASKVRVSPLLAYTCCSHATILLAD